MIIHCDTFRFISEVLEHGEYDFLFKDLVVIDAGCNVGAFTFWIEPLAREVHAIDVAEENIDMLNKSLKDSKVDKVKTYCCAIAGRNGPRWVSTHGGTPGGGGYQIKYIPGEGFKADGYTVASFMEKNHITRADVLKLDIEGAEREVLRDPTFPSDKISTIIGESHNIGADELKSSLVALGYTPTILSGHFIGRR